ncbi:hypothetical protein MMC21_007774 [Puttea exsequens]|nr:hypothetical protein [Puttea exsequens]
MSEARKGYVVIKEVKESTFARFAEWAYQGYYTSGEVIYRLLDDSGSEKRVIDDGRSKRQAESPPPAVEEPPVDPKLIEILVSPSLRLQTRRNRDRRVINRASSSEESPSAKDSSRNELKKSIRDSTSF